MDRRYINSIILCLMVFLPTLTLPVKLFTSSGAIVQLTTIVLLCIFLWKNGLKYSVILNLSLLTIVFLLSTLITQYGSIPISIYLEMLKLGFLYYVIANSSFDEKKFFSLSYSIALISFIIILWVLFLYKGAVVVSYMSIGVQLTYCSIPFIYYIYSGEKTKKALSILLLISILLITFVYANRMSIISILSIFFCADIIFSKNFSLKAIIKRSFIIILCLIFLDNIENILNYIIGLTKSQGYYSYSLNKLSFLLSNNESNTAFLSGRDYLYRESLSLIYNNSFFPKGIGYYAYMFGDSYPHNLLLELGLEWGAVAIPILVVASVCIYRGFSNCNKIEKFFFLSFFLFAITRLSVSTSYWFETPLWICLGYINSKKVRNKDENK